MVQVCINIQNINSIWSTKKATFITHIMDINMTEKIKLVNLLFFLLIKLFKVVVPIHIKIINSWNIVLIKNSYWLALYKALSIIIPINNDNDNIIGNQILNNVPIIRIIGI